MEPSSPRPLSSSHIRNYPSFLWNALGVATDGNLFFYTWMTVLTCICLVGVNAWAHQMVHGLGVTAMTDQVSWGIYVGNFTYCAGLASGTVILIIAAYFYRDKAMNDIIIIGGILAISAVVASLGFICVDLGRLERAWHMAPIIGIVNLPISMLSWDAVVLNVFLGINLHVVGYLLYMRYLGREPDKRWYLPFMMLSVVWAVSILSVEAFLYSGLGGRPFWNSAILAPRFITSALVTSPAFLVLTLHIVQYLSKFRFGHQVSTLIGILRVSVLVNLFMLGSEVFTQFYTGGAHVAAATYLYFGLDGKDALVPWIWTAIVFNVISAILLIASDRRNHLWLVDIACVLSLIGLWIEKGMGLVVPAFVPSTLHEIIEYVPNAIEWKISFGIGALGLMVFTLGMKLAIAVFSGTMHVATGDAFPGAATPKAGE